MLVDYYAKKYANIHKQDYDKIIFAKYEQRDYIKLDFVKDMNTSVPKNEFCSITLKISNRIDLYLLRYRKLQNTIADIGGVLKVITVIGTVLTFLY